MSARAVKLTGMAREEVSLPDEMRDSTWARVMLWMMRSLSVMSKVPVPLMARVERVLKAGVPAEVWEILAVALLATVRALLAGSEPGAKTSWPAETVVGP